MNLPKTQILAIVPKLRDERGHYYSFHLKANEAASLLGWDYVVACPTTTQTTHWPKHWKKCLRSTEMPRWPRFVRRIANKYLLQTSIVEAIKEATAANESTILFTEDPTPRLLRSLIRSLLCLPREKMSFWIHWQGPPSLSLSERLALRMRLQQLQWLLGERSLILTTITEPLTKRWESITRRSVSCLPYPMGPIEPLTPFPKENDTILCWWPGVPNSWKGQDNIQRLLDDRSPAARPIRVMYSEDAKLILGRGTVRSHPISAVLDRHTYLRWMASSDFILLPYDPKQCQERLSGVFVEAILLGRIPIVTDGTWMAQELRRHHLNELIVDWKSDNLVSTLLTMHSDATLANKLEPLRSEYQRYHCLESYATCMANLYKNGEKRP